MSDEVAYQAFIEWLKLSWHLPETEDLLALVKERYNTTEDIFEMNNGCICCCSCTMPDRPLYVPCSICCTCFQGKYR